MQIYNSLTRKKEALPKNSPIRLFVCGPTVYDQTHIGHARTYIFFDFFVKYLRSKNIKVNYIQNITDIDDKIIFRAKELGVSPSELAKNFTKEYISDMRTLKIYSVDKYASATKYIPQIILQTKKLIENGLAYKIDGDGYYYDISKFKDYGKLSGRTAEQAEDATSRIDLSVGKRNKGDFCLWKIKKEGEPSWKSELGEGRPGWHIEDTAISEKHFGPQYEIHGGGIDLKFPHHEAEIAQQEASSGKTPFVELWMHTGMLTVNEEKMSKSKNNFTTIKDMLKYSSPSAFRMLVLNHHWRGPMNYSEGAVIETESSILKLSEFLKKLRLVAKKGQGKSELKLDTYMQKFHDSLNNDLSTPGAIASIFELVSSASNNFWEINRKSAESIEGFVKETLEILGIELTTPSLPLKVKYLSAKREKYRTSQQFVKSDTLRKKINALGFEVEDTPLGPFVSKRTNSK